MLTFPDFTTLDSTAVADIQAELVQRLQEALPNVDLRRGVVHDLIAHTAALIATGQAGNIEQLRQSFSLKLVAEDPTLATDELVDALLANYRLARIEGSAARGEVRVVISRLVPMTIPSGFVFTAGDVDFVTESAFAIRTAESLVVSTTDRALLPLGDGNFAFTLPVVATAVGPEGALRRNASMIPVQPIVSFVNAYAEADFTDGIAGETTEELLTKLETGAAIRAYSSRTSIEAMIRHHPDFNQVLAVSVIGFGDAEMQRDKRSIVPFSGGGRTDVYVRTERLPRLISLTKTARLIYKESAGHGIWQFSVLKSDAPGFYRVRSVLEAEAAVGDAGFEVTEDIRALDLTAENEAPDLLTGTEGAYSKFQAATIRFRDTTTPIANLVAGQSEAEYRVELECLPLLDALQDFVGAPETVNPAGDVLVRAPIPAFLIINFTIHKPAAATAPDVAAIKADLAEAVNTLGFVPALYASLLSATVHAHLSAGMYLSAIDMFAQIRRPSGTLTYLRSNEVLQLPTVPAESVSPNTTVFFLDPSDIGIAVVDA